MIALKLTILAILFLFTLLSTPAAAKPSVQELPQGEAAEILLQSWLKGQE